MNPKPDEMHPAIPGPGSLKELAGHARAHAEEYRDGSDQPVGGYVGVLGIYGIVVTASAVALSLTGRPLPSRLRGDDVVTFALGGHKLSRTISKSAVMGPLRVPFTRFEGAGGPGEVQERVRSSRGLRHSLGELLTCPFCLDVWVVTGFTVGLLFTPNATRLVAGSLAALAGADFIHLAYARAQQHVE